MKLSRQTGGDRPLVFEEIEPFFLDLLRGLPSAADPGGNAAAQARLFSAPMARGMYGDEFNEDWERYVEPDIRSLFRTAQETVAEDLSPLPPAKADGPVGVFEPAAFEPLALTLQVPFPHAEAWLSVLNQARLVIAARRGFGEREMDQDLSFPPISERELDLFRLNFYAEIQFIILHELGY